MFPALGPQHDPKHQLRPCTAHGGRIAYQVVAHDGSMFKPLRFSRPGDERRDCQFHQPSWEVRVYADAEADMVSAEASTAICVQRFDDSRNSAIHTTYRISLRSSSLREPRYPSLRVVLSCRSSRVKRLGLRSSIRRVRCWLEKTMRQFLPNPKTLYT